MSDQIKGLLTCKPENTPHAGEVRKYTVTTPNSRAGSPYTKISNDNDGTPYTVISVAKTKFESDRGFVSFNLVIEPAPVRGGEGRYETAQDAPPASPEAPVGHFNQLPHQSSQKPPNISQQDYNTALGHHVTGSSGPGRQPHSVMSKDDYWTIKDQRDREREARQVAQQPRIERQHSQAMALQLAAIFPDLVTEEVSDERVKHFNFGRLHSLINQFQRDIGYVPKGENEPF